MVPLFLLFLIVNVLAEEDPIVNTPLGAVRGHLKTSHGGRKFSAFEGIPYAKPPNGDRRFEEAEPVEPWLGTWNARHLTECAQTSIFDPNVIQGDEDCLHINIYVPRPRPTPSEKLDVIVHIHGGAYAYFSGHAYARPEMIMDKDVIFVTFNYRLGVFGFLTTEDEKVPGNNGLKDQVLALQWVQKNIASFGGNPNSVTINGLSGGGSSVHLHYFSKMSENLFHRGFSQSGVALNPYSIVEGGLGKAKLLGKALGCPVDETGVLVECLKQRPFKEILDKVKIFLKYKVLPYASFGPVVEKIEGGFLSKNPYEMLLKGEVQDKPWMVSSLAHEGYIPPILVPEDLEYYNKNWPTFAPLILDFQNTLDKSQWASVSKKIKNFYFGDQEISVATSENFAQMMGDRTWAVGVEDSIKMQSKVSKSPIYYLYFSYLGDHDQYIGNGLEAKYYFGTVFEPYSLSPNELKMKDLLLDALVSFAKTGTPVIEGVVWKPSEGEQLTYLNVSSIRPEEITLVTVDEIAPTAFWKSLKFLENENLVAVKDEL